MPDTARWYVLKGRVADARRALLRVEPDARVEQELAEIANALSEVTGPRQRRGVRRCCGGPICGATVFVISLGVLAQISGINAIIYYSPLLFENMGFKGNFARLGVPALVQLAALVAVCASLVLVDRLGRRPILLSGIAMVITADAVLIAVFSHAVALVFGVVGVLMFIIGFNFGFGSLVWVYAGEAFPTRLRSIGSSTMLTFTLTANAIVAAGFLTMLHSLGGAGAFAVFGVFAVVAFGVVLGSRPRRRPPARGDPVVLGERWPLALIAAGAVVLDDSAADRGGWTLRSPDRGLRCGRSTRAPDVDLPDRCGARIHRHPCARRWRCVVPRGDRHRAAAAFHRATVQPHVGQPGHRGPAELLPAYGDWPMPPATA